MRLDAIIQYSMDEIEAKAYKLCCYWEDISKHEMPNYRVDRLPSGDPRKSFLFKCCRKLVVETQGLLDPTMYKFYVYAQISNLMAYSDGKVHSLIEPPCLFGPSAWIRWKIWKNKFDKMQKLQEQQGTTEDIFQTKISVTAELEKTKAFLESKNALDVKMLQFLIDDKTLMKWVAFNKVSPYFIILSNTIKSKIKDIREQFDFDPLLYRKSINLETLERYKEIFGDL